MDCIDGWQKRVGGSCNEKIIWGGEGDYRVEGKNMR